MKQNDNSVTTEPNAAYEVGDTVYDRDGNNMGQVVHRSYNDYTELWSYTVADNMSYYTGRFTLYTPRD